MCDTDERMRGWEDGIKDATNFQPPHTRDENDYYEEGYKLGYNRISTFVDILNKMTDRSLRATIASME